MLKNIVFFALIALVVCNNLSSNASGNNTNPNDAIQIQKIENQIRTFTFLNETNQPNLSNFTYSKNIFDTCKLSQLQKGSVDFVFRCQNQTLITESNKWVQWNDTENSGRLFSTNNSCEEYVNFTRNNGSLTGSAYLLITGSQQQIDCSIFIVSNNVTTQNIQNSLLLTNDETKASENYNLNSITTEQQLNNRTLTTTRVQNSNANSVIQRTGNLFQLITEKTGQAQINTVQTENEIEVSNDSLISSKSKQIESWFKDGLDKISGHQQVSIQKQESLGVHNNTKYADSIENQSASQEYVKNLTSNTVSWTWGGESFKNNNQTIKNTKPLNQSDVWNLNGTIDLNLVSLTNLEQPPQVPQQPQLNHEEKQKQNVQKGQKKSQQTQQKQEQNQKVKEVKEVKDSKPKQEKKDKQKVLEEL